MSFTHRSVALDGLADVGVGSSTRLYSQPKGRGAFVLIIHLCFSQAWDPESLFLCEDFSSPPSSLIPPFNFQVQPQRSLKSFHSELLLRVGRLVLWGPPRAPSPSCSLALSFPEPACQPPLSAPFPSGESLALTCPPPPPHLPLVTDFFIG